ncbi:NDR1/HIN1-like protein [Thalictrum thalictroides]|uniref:NDR1/HIN1-like protein n=1 Tax=Thalictrum thalictroides TaxID=46969 RepID=A0A7J6VCM3_THATH|nr:NDR1/HIN1-like protein [Thalictrum thalictroides]
MAGPASRRTGSSNAGRCILFTLIAIIVLLGLIVLITWLVIRPKKLVYTIESGKASGFELHKNHLNASFHFCLKAYNPNRRVALYYDSIQAFVFYDDQRIAFQTLEPFFQPRHNATRLEFKTMGQSVALPNSVAKDLRLEKASGDIELEIRLKARIRFKVGVWKSSHYNLKVFCSNVEIHPNSTRTFKQKECDVDT